MNLEGYKKIKKEVSACYKIVRKKSNGSDIFKLLVIFTIIDIIYISYVC